MSKSAKVKTKEHLLYKICPLLLQALKEAKAGSEMRVLFSRINDTLRRLEPTFSITQYGVSRSQGFWVLCGAYQRKAW